MGLEKIAKVLLVAAAMAVLSSFFFPYWWVKVKAPQYPKGLKVAVYLNRLEGDVQEIDSLNHYIGMRSLREGAKIERELSVFTVSVIAVFLIIAVFWRNKLSVLLVLPAIFFPAIFAADLYLWLRDFGLHLNPHAALSSSVKPFVPPLLGHGKIAQFQATADFSWGHGLSMLAMIFCVTALILRALKNKNLSHKTLISIASLIFLGGLFFLESANAETRIVEPKSSGSLQSAVDAAENEDILIVKPGVYQGPVIVRKSIRLIGEDFPVIDGCGKGTVVRLDAPDILFKGFIVRNSGDLLASEDTGVVASAKHAVIENNHFENVLFGAYLRQSPQSAIRNNTFKGKLLDTARRGDLIRVWVSNDALIEKNRTLGGRDVVSWYSKNIRVLGNDFKEGRYGLHFMYCKNATVEENKLTKNSVGVYLMYSAGLNLKRNIFSDNRGPSGYGIGFKDMENAVIEENIVTGNRVGFFIDGSSGGVCRKNLIAYNDIGAQLFPTARNNAFENNDFIDNSEQVTLDGQSVYTVNRWSENYWSDYRGFDANRDGIGDRPHRPMKLFERLTDHSHQLKVFFGSPSVQAIDFAASTFPVFAPAPKFEDEKPLMAPVTIPLKPETVPAPAWWVLISTGLLLPLLGFFKRDPVLSGTGPPFHVSQFSDSNIVIKVNDLTKCFKKIVAVSRFDLEIRRGEVVALWGPNGAGKTTLLRCLLGIIPFDGQAKVMGLDVHTQGKEIRRHIGYVPQEIRLHLDQTVLETVSFYAQLRRVSAERVEKLISEWGLSSAKKQLAQDLSGGMKQKLVLVIALLSDPPVLFLDEPTSNLDVDTRTEFDAALEHLKKAGKTLLFCSHRSAEVRKIADRVVVIEAGVKKKDGKPDDL